MSKGRWEKRKTVRALEKIGTPYKVVVEEDELAQYAEVIAQENLLVLDPAYKDAYQACDHHGFAKPIGSGPARNFAWDHALSQGAEWYWCVDDNIDEFRRLNRNQKIPVTDGTIFWAMENFAARYTNVVMAGPTYDYLAPRKETLYPYVPNHRIYSCNLIRTDVPFRWRGRYNEDTILSLDMLKAGYCTVLFNAFLQGKHPTGTPQIGGNVETVYLEGTLPKSEMLVDIHPDVARLTWKYGRWHHEVNYAGFTQPLLRRPGLALPEGSDEHGMELVLTETGELAQHLDPHEVVYQDDEPIISWAQPKLGVT